MRKHSVRIRPTKLRLHKTAFVAERAVLRGEITVGPKASVWFGAVLRGDIEPIFIGEASNVQDNCVLHTDFSYPLRVGKRVTVGHGAVLHGCHIGDDCLVSMGAMVLTGAVVGKGSFVAAGAVVLEGMEIPPRSLVLGVPAKIRGPVPASLARRIRGGARHYVEYARAYRALEG
jgi:carbonic anhydrase/acetyltransferase-like protein (isoleucine patch superfamily)